MGISLDELDRQLGESGSTHMLVGIIFEDFISRRIPPDELKSLENNENRRAASQGQKPYDSTWMWVDLGLI
ncbi:MAG: hypothetical protein O6928_00135 [Gammaproteobacteria bacterium]|nr:hypothetical protein [Gammaproteobacteria bacterium]